MAGPTTPSTPARVVLSHELSAFLVEFSIALQKHAIYPPGHPSLAPAAMRLTELVNRLLQNRPALAFGVARHQLIIDGVATDPRQPVLRRLAETLHQHHLGAISILPGIADDEMSGALETLAAEVSPELTPLGLSPAGLLPEWAHLRLHPLTLDRLELVDEDQSPAPVTQKPGSRRPAQLWIGLANAALMVDASSPSVDATLADPAVVAKAIDDHAGAAAYDQVIVGYLLQIADELKSASGTDHGALRRRTARLINALRPETLQRLVTMGGNMSQRRAFVLGATSGMAVESVVQILKAAADASGQTISHGLVRMLSKLATHAEAGAEHARPIADRALREQVEQLLSGWDLENPSPTTYVKTLQHLATNVGPDDTRRDASKPYEVDAMHIVRTALEVGGAGPIVERAIDRAIDEGHVHSLQVLLSFLPPGRPAQAADILRSKLGSARVMAALVTTEPLDVKTLDALLPALSYEGYEVLLDALIASEHRGTRRKLLERLAPSPLDVAPLIVDRLQHDDRWYVQRNLLLLLERLGTVPPGFSVRPWTQHRDARVRYHGIALQLTLHNGRDPALRAALEDKDERIALFGLVAAQDICPLSLIPLVAHFATNPRVREDLRIQAVKALGRTKDRYALDTLLRLAQGGTTMFGRPKLAPTPVVLATLRALSDCWAGNAEVASLLALARRSSAPALRDAVKAVSV